jgi:hypothetical protein
MLGSMWLGGKNTTQTVACDADASQNIMSSSHPATIDNVTFIKVLDKCSHPTPNLGYRWTSDSLVGGQRGPRTTTYL